MWEKAKQYLHKMGGIILIASIIIWFLGYFPRHSENGDVFEKQIAEVEQSDTNPEDKAETIAELERLKSMDHQQKSYIGRIGQAIQPILHPLGFDWKMSVSLLTGMAAKEVVVTKGTSSSLKRKRLNRRAIRQQAEYPKHRGSA